MFNIAIDGPSAAGKTTIARLLAQGYDMKHIDTGSMYRALAYGVKQHQIDEEDEEEIVAYLNELTISFSQNGNVILNDQELDSEIRNDEISRKASNISKFAGVRKALVLLQQKISIDGGYILDGRDVGSVILPKAQIKLYLDGSDHVRSKRRYDEYVLNGKQVNYENLHKEMCERDTQDKNRENSPLICVEDAYFIDTTNLSIDEVMNLISLYIKDKGVE